MEKAQSKTKKTVKPATKKSTAKKAESKGMIKDNKSKIESIQKEVKPPKKSTRKIKEVTPVVEKKEPKKTAAKKSKAIKTTPVKTVTVVLEEPIKEQVSFVTEPTKEISTPRKTRNIFQLYFSGWMNMFSFAGRANRTEFLVFWNISILLFPLFVPHQIFSANLSYALIIAYSLLITALFTLSIRRSHDIGRSGFWGALLFFLVFGVLSMLASMPQFTIIYILSIFAYFLLALISGSKEANRYGEKPREASKIALILSTLLSYILLAAGFKLLQLLWIFFSYYI